MRRGTEDGANQTVESAPDRSILRVYALSVGSKRQILSTSDANVEVLADLSGAWIDRVHDRRLPKMIILDMGSSVSPTHGEPEGTAYNGHLNTSTDEGNRKMRTKLMNTLRKATIALVGIGALAGCATAPYPAYAQSAGTVIPIMVMVAEKDPLSEKEDIFEGLAKELLAKLNPHRNSPPNQVIREDKPKDGPLRISIWPFEISELSVPEPLAQSWNESLLHALLKASSGGIRFITRSDLRTLIKETMNMDLLGEIENPVAAVADEAKVDALIIGTISPVDDGVRLSYRVVNMKGEILVATGKRLLPIDFADVGVNRESLTLDAAIVASTLHFANLGPALESIRIQGVRYADRGVQTSFGSFVAEAFLDALQMRMNNSLSGFRLKVLDAVVDAHRLSRMRGTNATASDVVAALSGDDPGSYLLSGNYWDTGRHVLLRLAIRNVNGEGGTWNGRIHKSSIPSGMELVPSSGGGAKGGSHGYGPFGLELTSNKGTNPVFHIGETMVILVRISRDAFLNCFYRQADGKLFKIFPNKYVKSGLVAGGAQQQIPDPEMPFDFTMNEPSGVERVRCFALNRDVSGELPLKIDTSALIPIPGDMETHLVSLYRALPNVQVTEAVMMVTVLE